MSKSTKRLSVLLAVLMVIGLFTAFPATAKQAAPAVTVKSDAVNVASNATYKGSDLSDGTANFGEASWDTYHSGKLNDGVIATEASDTVKGLTVETYINGWVSGTTYITFKFEKKQAVESVNFYANNRANSTNRGYPTVIKAYVGDSEDVASATLLGEATTTDTTTVRKYTATATEAIEGTYVIFELGIKAPEIVIAVTEIEIMATEVVEYTLRNHAADSTYKGTGTANGTYNYGEADWNVYHTGRLIDGVIPAITSNTENSKGQNIEMYLTGFAAGTFYIYFKFDYEIQFTTINAYFNTRSANLRGYPATVEAYVGNGEDIAAATYFGELIAQEPNISTGGETQYVQTYSAEGDATGTYVILAIETISSATVPAISEVELYGYGEQEVVTEKLATPVIDNLPTEAVQSFDKPTITWGAVENASSYDVYLDGEKVAEGLTERTYTPNIEASDSYNSASSYNKLQVVAKGNGETYTDSALSESYNFFYCKKPIDKDGNPVTEADFIIDSGHGGTDPGATNGDRNEKDDTLAMALKVGSMLEDLGYTVAYTRTTDVLVGLMSRAIEGNAGNFKAYICIHRNSFSAEAANGVETLHQTGDANDEAFAQLVQDELMALGLFTNRGLKPRDNLVVLNNTKSTLPTILIELGFISNTKDNTLFDEYNDDIAFAIVKGAMAQIGDTVSYSGTVGVIDPEIGNMEIDVDNKKLEIKDYVVNDYIGYFRLNSFTFEHTFGVKGYQYTIDGENWIDFEGGESTLHIEFDEAGDYTVAFRIIHDHDAYKIYTASDVVFEIGITVEETLIGDVNNDGVVDTLDAALILKYLADVEGVDFSAREMYAADVNHDGKIIANDAAMILKYCVGLIDEF